MKSLLWFKSYNTSYGKRVRLRAELSAFKKWEKAV
jgi:hypothetical protein